MKPALGHQGRHDKQQCKKGESLGTVDHGQAAHLDGSQDNGRAVKNGPHQQNGPGSPMDGIPVTNQIDQISDGCGAVTQSGNDQENGFHISSQIRFNSSGPSQG